VPYHKGDITGPLVAVDLYFPLTAKKALLRSLVSWAGKNGVPVTLDDIHQMDFEGR
jgi:hypothetical protein